MHNSYLRQLLAGPRMHLAGDRGGLGDAAGPAADAEEVENDDPRLQVEHDVQSVEVHVHEAVGTVVSVVELRGSAVDVEDLDVDEVLLALEVLPDVLPEHWRRHPLRRGHAARRRRRRLAARSPPFFPLRVLLPLIAVGRVLKEVYQSR